MSGVLTLEQRGDSAFGRWVLLNCYGWAWNDDRQEFVEDQDDGTLYCDVNSACKKMQDILLVEHGHKKKRRFVAPVEVTLFCDDHINLEKISTWCCKASRLILHENHGLGPLNAVGLLTVNWGKLKELDPTEGN